MKIARLYICLLATTRYTYIYFTRWLDGTANCHAIFKLLFLLQWVSLAAISCLLDPLAKVLLSPSLFSSSSSSSVLVAVTSRPRRGKTWNRELLKRRRRRRRYIAVAAAATTEAERDRYKLAGRWSQLKNTRFNLGPNSTSGAVCSTLQWEIAVETQLELYTRWTVGWNQDVHSLITFC